MVLMKRVLCLVLFMILSLVLTACTSDEYSGTSALKSTGTSDYLFDLKTSSVEDNSDVERLLDVLDVGLYGHYTSSVTPYEWAGLLIDYSQIEGWGPISRESMIEKSAILLALIDNAHDIYWKFPDDNQTYTVTIDDLNPKYGNIKDYGKSSQDLKLLLVKLGYYESEEDQPVTMSIKDITNKGLSLTLINNTNNDYQYGASYSIEKKENDKWVPVKPIKEDCVFYMVAYDLKANQRVSMEYSWEMCYGKLPKGQYRINKDFSDITYKAESESGNKHFVSIEFVI